MAEDSAAPAEIGIIKRVAERPPLPARRPAWGRVLKVSTWRWWVRSWWRRKRLE